jgi:hypothetical protein
LLHCENPRSRSAATGRIIAGSIDRHLLRDGGDTAQREDLHNARVKRQGGKRPRKMVRHFGAGKSPEGENPKSGTGVKQTRDVECGARRREVAKTWGRYVTRSVETSGLCCCAGQRTAEGKETSWEAVDRRASDHGESKSGLRSSLKGNARPREVVARSLRMGDARGAENLKVLAARQKDEEGALNQIRR